MTFLRSLWLYAPAALRLRVYRFLIYVGMRWYGPTGSARCYRLPFNLYAKTGLNVFISEANAMRHIERHTTIPIPSVIDVIQGQPGTLIVMSRVVGEPIGGHLKTMSSKERSLLALDLKNCFDQLRSLPAPPAGPRVCGVGGGSFICYRIESDPIGPFDTEPDFYCYLFDRVYLQERRRLEEFGREVHIISHRICLSHNDLSPHNILINHNRRLTAIIDWECAAWLPEYWEYTRSHFHRDSYHEWQQLMDDALGARPEELRVEREMWKYNDPF